MIASQVLKRTYEKCGNSWLGKAWFLSKCTGGYSRIGQVASGAWHEDYKFPKPWMTAITTSLEKSQYLWYMKDGVIARLGCDCLATVDGQSWFITIFSFFFLWKVPWIHCILHCHSHGHFATCKILWRFPRVMGLRLAIIQTLDWYFPWNKPSTGSMYVCMVYEC